MLTENAKMKQMKKAFVEVKELDIDNIQLNEGQLENIPKNPRTIKDEEYLSLIQSLKNFPEMRSIREVVVVKDKKTGKFVVVGGNKRTMALKEIGEKKILAKELINFPDQKIREFVLKDNKSYGTTDFEALEQEWNKDELSIWDIEMPLTIETSEQEEEQDNNQGAYKIEVTLDNIESQEKLYEDLTSKGYMCTKK